MTDNSAPECKGPLFMTDEQAKEKLLSGEAMQSAKRLIDWFFKNDTEKPRASIPARPTYDDDLIVTDCLRFAARICAADQGGVTVQPSARDTERLRTALRDTLRYIDKGHYEMARNVARAASTERRL